MDDRFRHYFRFTVRAVCLEACRFGNGYDRWSTVDGGRGGIYEADAIKCGHGLKEAYGRRHVVKVIGDGNLGRLSDRFVRL
jgi:hypothetical protein